MLSSAAVLAGCGQITAATGSSIQDGPTEPASQIAAGASSTRSSPASPVGSSSPSASAAFVVVRVTKTFVDGNIYLAPPPAGARPRIGAAKAFAEARRSWGNPGGTAVPEVVLTRYTNDGQGTMLPDGGIKRFDVNRLAWAVVDSGATCTSAGPAGSGQRVFHDCLFISFVDARTGQDRGSMDEGGPGVRAPSFGPPTP